MIPVEKIFEEIVAQAKHGSCKTCRWCRALKKPDILETGIVLTHSCEFQGNVNPMWFTDENLNAGAYPGRCDGAEYDTEEGRSICLAYQPSLGGIPDIEALKEHRDFIENIVDAWYLYNAMKDNTLAKLTAKLNEATESLPKPRTGGNSKLDEFLNSLGVL